MEFQRFPTNFSSIFGRTASDEATESEARKKVVWSSLPGLAFVVCRRFVLLLWLSKWLLNNACSAFFRCVPTSPPSCLKIPEQIVNICDFFSQDSSICFWTLFLYFFPKIFCDICSKSRGVWSLGKVDERLTEMILGFASRYACLGDLHKWAASRLQVACK